METTSSQVKESVAVLSPVSRKNLNFGVFGNRMQIPSLVKTKKQRVNTEVERYDLNMTRPELPSMSQAKQIQTNF